MKLNGGHWYNLPVIDVFLRQVYKLTHKKHFIPLSVATLLTFFIPTLAFAYPNLNSDNNTTTPDSSDTHSDTTIDYRSSTGSSGGQKSSLKINDKEISLPSSDHIHQSFVDEDTSGSIRIESNKSSTPGGESSSVEITINTKEGGSQKLAN